jgi:hypothetical protein
MKNTVIMEYENSSFVIPYHKRAWFKKSMKELNKTIITLENQFAYNLTWARLIANAQYEEMVDKKWETEWRNKVQPEEISLENWQIEYQNRLKIEKIEKLLELYVAVEKIAELMNVPVNFITEIQSKMAENQAI